LYCFPPSSLLSFVLRCRGNGLGAQRHQRKPQLLPLLISALERPDPLDTAPPERERRTGARGFVGSTAEERDLAIARNLAVPEVEVLERDVQRPGESLPIRVELDLVSQVDHQQRLARLDPLPQLLRRDARRAQLADVPAREPPDQRREAVAKLNEKPVLALSMRLKWEGFSAESCYWTTRMVLRPPVHFDLRL